NGKVEILDIAIMKCIEVRTMIQGNDQITSRKLIVMAEEIRVIVVRVPPYLKTSRLASRKDRFNLFGRLKEVLGGNKITRLLLQVKGFARAHNNKQPQEDDECTDVMNAPVIHNARTITKRLHEHQGSRPLRWDSYYSQCPTGRHLPYTNSLPDPI